MIPSVHAQPTLLGLGQLADLSRKNGRLLCWGFLSFFFSFFLILFLFTRFCLFSHSTFFYLVLASLQDLPFHSPRCYLFPFPKFIFCLLSFLLSLFFLCFFFVVVVVVLFCFVLFLFSMLFLSFGSKSVSIYTKGRKGKTKQAHTDT